MLLATLAVGVLAGVGGVALVLLLHLVQHLAFGYVEGAFLFGVERSSPARRVLALAAGGVVVALCWWWHRRHVDAEEVSVTRALREPGGRLPVVATAVDAVFQVVAVGVGASLGREGAPRQTGAALGDWIARRVHVTETQRRTLLACGAGAGLAAVYNVPLGGAAFTLEILLASISLRDVVPALVTSVVATVVTWPVLGDRPTYDVVPLRFSAPVLVCALVLGPVAGLFGAAFSRTMTAARTHAPTGARAVVSIPAAFAVLGAIAIVYPQLLGNGKGEAQLALGGSLSLATALALVVLKPLTTALCLRAGAIGGLLTPSFATGAVLGVVAAHLWGELWPGGQVGAYAAVGAAAMLAATQRSPLTAIVLTPELMRTGEGSLPAIVVGVVLAEVVTRLVGTGSLRATSERNTV